MYRDKHPKPPKPENISDSGANIGKVNDSTVTSADHAAGDDGGAVDKSDADGTNETKD